MFWGKILFHTHTYTRAREEFERSFTENEWNVALFSIIIERRTDQIKCCFRTAVIFTASRKPCRQFLVIFARGMQLIETAIVPREGLRGLNRFNRLDFVAENTRTETNGSRRRRANNTHNFTYIQNMRIWNFFITNDVNFDDYLLV